MRGGQPGAIVGSRHAPCVLARAGRPVRKIVADETDRRLYLVELNLRGLSSPQLASVDRALGEAVRRENGHGSQIRYVQRIYAPDEQRCLCLFEAAGPDQVRSVNDIAQFPLARVIAVLSSVPARPAQRLILGRTADEPVLTARGTRGESMNGIRKLAEIPAGSWTKWVVVGFWAVVLVLAFPRSTKLMGAEKNDASAWLPASAESTQVLNVQARFQSPNIYPGVVVYERPSGLTAADRAKAAADARRFAAVPGVVPGQIVGPIESADGKALETILQVNLGSKGYADANKAVDAIRAITNSNANGLVSHITGPLGSAADSNNVFKSISGTLLYSAVAVVIVILLITYRSPVPWLLPVISSGVALITAEAVIYLLAAHAGLAVNGLSAGVLEVLVFGASTDYALLIVARYREELRRHDRRHPAMAEALRRAGPAIIASAATVVVALLTLSAAELNSTKSLGPVLAIGVAVGMVVMITLLPALMVTFPRGVFWPYRPTYDSAEPTAPGVWARVGWRIAARPRITWITTAVILGVLALGLTGLKASGLTAAQGFRGHPDSVVGETVLGEHFPAGTGTPVIVVGNATRGGPAAGRLRRHPGDRRRDAAGDRGGLRLPRGDADRGARQPGRVRHDRPGAVHGACRPRRRRPGGRHHGDHAGRRARERDTTVRSSSRSSSPWCSSSSGCCCGRWWRR